MTTIPTFVCTRCPTNADAFYCRSLSEFMEHIQVMHGLFPNIYVQGIPLDLRPQCRSCGEELDVPLRFDGWCGPCFWAKWGE